LGVFALELSPIIPSYLFEGKRDLRTLKVRIAVC
jgi:hypothetical protein